MRDDGKRKGKIERALSIGVAILVFLMLATQFAVFLKYIIKNERRVGDTVASAVEAPAPQSEFRGESQGGYRSDSQGEFQGEPQGSSKSGARGKSSGASQGASDGGRSSATGTSAAGVRNDRHGVLHSDSGPTYDSDRHTYSGAVSRGSSSFTTPSALTDSSGRTSPDGKNEYVHDGWVWDRVELNSADSAALEALPWIGPYYAREIIRYRTKLWGSYADLSQLLDIRGIDAEMLDKLSDRLYIDPASVNYIDLYSLSEDSLGRHPYIGPYAAKGIVRYRDMVAREAFSLQTLVENRILSEAMARRLSLYLSDR